MKSDISRQTFDPRKHYNRVIMQQGRVQLDADWNEQQDILLHRIETHTRDMIGQSGVPQEGGGFDIRFLPGDRDLEICPGRLYIDGLLCELEPGTVIPVTTTEDDHVQIGDDYVHVAAWTVDGRAFKPGQWVELLSPEWQRIRRFQIKEVDADQHTLIFFIDKASPVIDDLEKSNIGYVRRILTYTTQPDYPAPTLTRYIGDTHLPELDLRDEHYLLLVYLDVWQRHISSLDDERIREVALAGPDTTTRIQTLWQVKILPITLPRELLEKIQEDADKSRNINFDELQAIALQTAGEARQRYEMLNRLEQEIMEQFNTLTCTASYSEWDALSPHDPGTLKATTSSTDDTEYPEYSGYWVQENQLYRVEIHEGTEDAPHPTFKWARNNASILAQGKVNDTKVTIDSTGQSGILCFQTGQWIEVVTTQTELNTKPGTLLKITNTDTTTSQLTLASSLPEGEKGADITLRLWDGEENIGRSGQWIPLEGGIKIQFSEGTYKSGDYWLIPARRATKEIEWPPYQVPNTEPAALLPHGIQHHYTRLARVRRYRARHYNAVSVRDCRRHFSPLPDSADALHIVGINWRNGATYTRHFLKEGLHITLDAELDPRYTRAMSPAMIVTLETALPGGGKGLFVMNGTFEIKSNVISWHWERGEKEGIFAKFFEEIDEWFSVPEHPPLLRVRLKGHTIWHNLGNRLIYLDGQTFGVPGLQVYGQEPWIDLQFPSGAGVRASDFESWFYLKE